MKTRRLFLIIALAFVALGGIPTTSQAQRTSVNFSLFYNELGQYGRWMNNPKYGQVWIYNEPNFRPYYSGGHWDYTQFGWSWVSDYPWGWAPFHYGRWEEDPFYGWMWIPGYDWGPAWVSWSEYDGYYGWAPLGYGVNFNINIGAIPHNHWVFVPRQRICEYNVYNYYVQPKSRYFNKAVIINNYYNYGGNRYWAGPNRVEVERYAQRPIQTTTPQYRGNTGIVGRQDQNRNWDGQNNRAEQNPVLNPNRIYENRQPQPTQDNRNNRNFDRQPNQNPVVENRVPQIESQRRDWDNRPGSQDRRIMRDPFPQQNNQPGNVNRNRVENQQPSAPQNRSSIPQGRQSIIQNNNWNPEKGSPRNFPTHNNPVMRSEGNNKPNNDARGNQRRIR